MADKVQDNKQHGEHSPCEICGLKQLKADVSESVIILKRLDGRSVAQGRQLDRIETQGELQEQNVGAIASGIGEIVKTNADAMKIIAGKKQVPLSTFMMILGIFAVGFFVILVTLARVQLVIRPGTVIVNPESGVGQAETKKSAADWTLPTIEFGERSDGVTNE